ncbi:hypothetical protein C8Q79DRAFT_999797 [Trametes meyenii]|nr:hypothetical protein C8Q79DRAFT_999797 [Trametes meyenii]
MTHDTPARPRDGPWYVTLGKRNARKLQNMTFSQGGRYADPFPIIFKLPSEELADEVLMYRDTIKLIERANKMVDRVRLTYTLPVGDTILENQGLYVVAYGNQSGVFYDHQDAVSAAKGVPTAIWKKVPDFRRAIAYMVSGGQSEKPVDADVKDELNKLLTQYIASRSSPVSYGSPDVGLATPPRSCFMCALPVSPSPRRAQTQSAVLSPSTSSRAHPTSGVPRVKSPSPKAYPPPGPARSPAPPSSSPLRSLTPLLAEPVFDLSLAEARHTWNLRGIKGTHAYPQVDVTKVLSCGGSLDMFLQAQGYDVPSKLTIAYACSTSETMEGPSPLSPSSPPVPRMVLFGKGRRLAARQEAAEAQRKYVTRLQRKPYREHRKVISIPKTPAERKVLADIQTEKREKIVDALTSTHETLSDAARQMQEEFGGHNQKYYEQQILQLARLKGSKCKANPWNAYLRHELEKRNKAEEKERMAETLIQELEELREMKSLSLQTVPISSFHDVRGGMSKMFEDARQQFARTGYNLIIIGCKTSRDQISPPMTFATSQAALDFFPMTLGTTLDDLVSSFEAYSLSRVPGLVGRSVDVIQGLQSHASGLIVQKLGNITERAAHKMFYFGVVINNWPLPRFSSPSNLRTCIELTMLINSWETGVSWFRKLTRREWDHWQGPDFVRAVSLASHITPAVPQGVSAATDVDGTSTISVQSYTTPGPSVAPEKTLALPASKPHKRRSDFRTSRKKRKGKHSCCYPTEPTERTLIPGAAADATETGGDTEALAMSRPTAAAAATSHATTSTPPSTASLEPTPPSVGLATVTSGVPTLSGTSVSAPPGPSAVGAAGTSFASTCPGTIVSRPTVVPAPTTVGASATASPTSAVYVPQASQSVFNLPAFSFAPEPLPSPGPWGYNPAVHPSLGVVPHQWHITPDYGAYTPL